MNDLKKVIHEYLAKNRIMQIATSINDQPWNCSVHFTYDDSLNLYWISKPDTRHSQEIMQNPKVAGVILSHEQPKNSVNGLSFEGIASLPSGDDEEKASKLYIKQFNREKTLLADIRSGKNSHKLYRIIPTKFILFNSANAPTSMRQEYAV